jgi:hypothetical protein
VTSFTPTSSTRALDVTGQVQALVSNGDSWVGYRLSSSASATRTDPQAFDMTGANRVTLSLSYVSLPVDVIVHLGGLGDGTVTSNPAGIDCPGTCTWWFEYTEPVTLTASPQNGGSFSHWEGGDCDASTNPICSFQAPATFFESTAFFDPIAPPVSQPPGATPTPAQLTPPPLPTAHASTGPLPTGAPARTTAPTGGPAPTLGPAPTDVIASDGTIITPPPPTLAPGATPAPTIVGLDGGAGDAATTGGVPLPLLIVLVLVLGGVVGGGVYWFTKRRQDAAPPPQA